jgi:signal transduction histidine kinase
MIPKIRLNIRQKIVLGFALSLAALVLIGIVGYRQLLRIEHKERFVLLANGLHNTILEVRRFEKNFLLYGEEEDYSQALSYLEAGRKYFEGMNPEIRGLKGAQWLGKIQEAMGHYGGLLTDLMQEKQKGGAAQPQVAAIETSLRKTGKDLIDLSLQLAQFEHDRIMQILHSLRRSFAYLVAVIVFLGVFLMFLVTRKILNPLRVIERTTLRIAEGNFSPLPVRQTHDETQPMVEAFNKMISELEKRQVQLVQAQKLSSLGVLTSGIAHQLNNPLNNISTSCQIVMEEIDAGEREHLRKFLTNIDQEVDRARDIVKGLLDFSREREFQLDWINLENLVIRTIRLVSSQLPAGVEISSDIPEDLDIYVDGQKFQEVLLNLLFNAIQAMPDDTGRINIEVSKGYRNVKIMVKDNGCGIVPEHLPHIFDPFFTTKEVGYGSGLGLSVAHGIVERHGGTITVSTKVGEGTVFAITLPLGSESHSGDDGA